MNHNAFTRLFAKGLHLFFIVALAATLNAAAGNLIDVRPVKASATISFQFLPTDDGSVSDDTPFDGMGDSVQNDGSVLVFFTAGVAEARGVMEFDLGSIVPGSSIQSAFLKFVPIGGAVLPGTPAIPVELFGFPGDGIVRTDDFNAGSLITSYDALTTPVPVVLDITNFLQNQPLLERVGFSLRTHVHGVQINVGSLETGSPAILSVELTLIETDIDIKPKSFPNVINVDDKGNIPVAILTTAAFDATTVDPLSVKFGPNGAREAHNKGHVEDVDNDGDLDIVLHFPTQATGIALGDTQACLIGQTTAGVFFKGCDSILTKARP